MSLPSLFSSFSLFLHSPQFRDLARHAGAGNAFVRKRKLPLPALVAVMLSGMSKSVQTELDEFFAHLKEQAQLVHHVSEQAFAKARAKLSTTAIHAPNDWLVAADASTLRFGRRASHVARAASADQIAFGLYLPGAEMILVRMSTTTFAQELAARLVGNDQYWSLLATLQSKGVIETLHRKPADVPIAPSDLAKLLYCAEVFVQTEDESLHKQAQEIAIHTLLVSNHDDVDEPRERALPLLTELGNFPGLNYVERNLSKSTPSLLGLINRSVSERLNTVAFGDETWALTAYQKRVWNSLHKTRASVISAPMSAGKSFPSTQTTKASGSTLPRLICATKPLQTIIAGDSPDPIANIVDTVFWLPARQRTEHRPLVKVGRNEPCPCGSGRKYKRCCGNPI